MSNIPLARKIIETLAADTSIPISARRQMRTAIGFMIREKPVKMASRKVVAITAKMRTDIKSLARKGLTNHQIAQRVGLRNGGRVTEILTGKR